MNFYIENLTHPVPHSADYPGTRIDAVSEAAAITAYTAQFSPQPGDRLRVDPGSAMTWYTVQAQPPIVAVSAAAATLPAVGS